MNLPFIGLYLHSSIKVLILSTPLFDAASISTISILLLSRDNLQHSHCPHGSAPMGLLQLIALENIFAILVFPVPLGPQNKYA